MDTETTRSASELASPTASAAAPPEASAPIEATAKLPSPPLAPPGHTDPRESTRGATAAASASPSGQTHGFTSRATSSMRTPDGATIAMPLRPPPHSGTSSHRSHNPKQKTWKSGDFRIHPRTTKPYNGVEITVDPGYDSKGHLFKLTITIDDFTLHPKGAKATHKIESVDSGSELHIAASGDLTFSGILKLVPSGQVPEALILMVENGSYGLKDHRRHVIGGLLEIPIHQTPSASHHRGGDSQPGTHHHGSGTHSGSRHGTSSQPHGRHEPDHGKADAQEPSAAHQEPTSPSASMTGTQPPDPKSDGPSSMKAPPAARKSPIQPTGIKVVRDGKGGIHMHASFGFHFEGTPMKLDLEAHIEPRPHDQDQARTRGGGEAPPITPPRPQTDF